MPSPQSVTPAPPLGSWRIARDILIAPRRAFAAIALQPAWLPAFVIIFVSGLLATLLSGPAFAQLAATASHAAGSSVSADRAASSRELLFQIALQQAVIIPLATIGLLATILTLVARFKQQTTSYAVYFSLAANCLIPYALGTLVSALGIRLHDPNSFHDWRAYAIAVPDNLALFANPKNVREILFLGQFDIFNLWSYLLLAYGMLALIPVRLGTALAVVCGLDVCLTLLF